MGDPLLDRVVTEAGRRLQQDLAHDLPAAAPEIQRHLRRVPSLSNPAASLGPEAFPIFAMPLWIMPEDRREAEFEFLVDLSYSTLSGYYAIRLIDNVADGDGPAQLRAVLPAAGYFDWRFVAPYQRYFTAEHEFWAAYHRLWAEQANLTAADAMLTVVGEGEFRTISSRKFGATKIPLTAVAMRHDKLGVLEEWHMLVDDIGALVQFWNDFLDWQHDHDHGIVTWLQSEAGRTRREGEDMAGWFRRHGFAWGHDRLDEHMGAVEKRSEDIANASAVLWSTDRRRVLERQLSVGAKDPTLVGKGATSLGERGSEH